MVDLLPCPFCGGAGRIVEGSRWQEINNARYYIAEVRCVKCRARTGVFMDATNRKEKEKAVKAWNTRIPLDKA